MSEVEIRFISFSVFWVYFLKILTEAWRFIILWISERGQGSWHRSNSIPLNICMRMICGSHTNLIPELQLFMFPIPVLIQLGLISIPIPEFYDFDFNYDSIQKNLILILIPIPASCDPDCNVDSHKPGFDSDSNSGIWFWVWYHLRLWSILNAGNFILYFIAKGASVWNSSLWRIITSRFFSFS